MFLYLENFSTGQWEGSIQEGYLDGQKVTRVSLCVTQLNRSLSSLRVTEQDYKHQECSEAVHCSSSKNKAPQKRQKALINQRGIKLQYIGQKRVSLILCEVQVQKLKIHAKKAVQGFQKGLDKFMKDNPDITTSDSNL